VKISEIFSAFFSPHIFRKSHKSLCHNSKRFQSNRIKSACGGGGKIPPTIATKGLMGEIMIVFALFIRKNLNLNLCTNIRLLLAVAISVIDNLQLLCALSSNLVETLIM